MTENSPLRTVPHCTCAGIKVGGGIVWNQKNTITRTSFLIPSLQPCRYDRLSCGAGRGEHSPKTDKNARNARLWTWLTVLRRAKSKKN